MLKKRDKKSYGAHIDYFLQECKVVKNGFDVTHIHIISSHKGFSPGIYRYEPKTGVLTKDEEFIGVLDWKNVNLAKEKIVLLKNKETWENMIKEGIIKGDVKDEEWNKVEKPNIQKIENIVSLLTKKKANV